MKNAIVILALLCLSGCTQYIVRDATVYQAEVNMLAMGMERQAKILKESYIGNYCYCTEGKFTTEYCRQAADAVVMVDARMEWHKAMMLYLGGLTEVRPPKEEAIPAPETLCPKK
jgi:hypothetical protein